MLVAGGISMIAYDSIPVKLSSFSEGNFTNVYYDNLTAGEISIIETLMVEIKPVYLQKNTTFIFANNKELEKKLCGKEGCSGAYVETKKGKEQIYIFLPLPNIIILKTICHELLHSFMDIKKFEDEEPLVADISKFYTCYRRMPEPCPCN